MSSQTTSRACVFIDSSNTSHQVINLSSQPIIKIPFPPVINPRNLVVKNKNGKLPARVPNAFIIYRKSFIETARNDGYHLPMTVISSMASQSWEQEDEVVKAEYKRLAKEAYKVRNEMLPKSQRKRKREKWNIISFEEQNGKDSKFKIQEPSKDVMNNKLTFSEAIQFTSFTSSPESQSDSSPIIPQNSSRETSPLEIKQIEQFNFDFTKNNKTSNVPSPEILSIEEEITNTINEQFLSSPSDFSNISSSLNSTPDTNTNESQISFDLLTPINENYQNYQNYHIDDFEGLGISDPIGFIPTLPNSAKNILLTSEMLNVYTYDATNVTNSTNVTEPSCGLNFDYL